MVVALKYELPAPDESSKPTTHYRTSHTRNDSLARITDKEGDEG